MKRRTASVFIVMMLIVSCIFTGCMDSADVIDYSKTGSWAYAQTEETAKNADLFFVCPTVYGGSEDESDSEAQNMSLDDDETMAQFLGATNMEKGIYEDECRLFVPYYRQAGLSVYTMPADEREEFLAFAYEDVCDAFEYYLENYNEGRPIVLAGFSQGADMCIRLIKDYFDDEEVSDLLVACYAIGWSFTEEETEEYPQLVPAESEDDTGVVISFNSEAENVESSLTIPEGTKTFAINPLNWKTDSTPAGKELNKGACFTDYEGNIINEIPQLTGAYIDEVRGALKVTDVTPEDYPAGLDIFEEGVYHLYDYQFFFRNLEENVRIRIQNYMR